MSLAEQLSSLTAFTFEDFITYIKIQDDWGKTVRYYNDIFWYNYSIAGMVPLLLLSLYRFFYPMNNVDQYLNADNFKRQKGYYIEKFLTSFGLFYYILDTILTLIDGSYTNVCRFSFLTHHIPSIPVMYGIFRLNYMPWWALVIAGWHALLIYEPDIQLLNYPYLAFVFIFHYSIALKKPFCTMKAFKFIAKCFPFLYIPLIIIWWTECKNIVPFL